MVPIIDLDSRREQRIAQLGAACADWGFFQVSNHGIDQQLIAALQAASRSFFSQAVPAKQTVSRTEKNPFGYYARELTKNQRDRKEIFDFAPAEPTPWPNSPPNFRAVLEDYALACHRLALELLELCCLSLGVKRNTLESHFQCEHSSFLRLNHYPVDDPLAGADAPAAGPLGISQHSDAGALTVLLQDQVPGLQVLRDDRWLDVPPFKDCLTINIGDMLQVWSNDLYRAPLHRVRASRGVARYSAAYFCNPHYDTVVQPLSRAISTANTARYRPVHWGEFRQQRALGDYGDYGEEVQIDRFRI